MLVVSITELRTAAESQRRRPVMLDLAERRSLA